MGSQLRYSACGAVGVNKYQKCLCKSQAFRDALQLQSSVNGAAANCGPTGDEASTVNTMAAVMTQEPARTDAACQVESTSDDITKICEGRSSSGTGSAPTSAAAESEEQSQALNEAKTEVASLKVRSPMHYALTTLKMAIQQSIALDH